MRSVHVVRRNIFVGTTTGLLLALMCSPAAFGGSATIYKDKVFGVNVTSNIVYDIGTGLTLDLYEPQGSQVPTLKPAMVLVHGGAWAFGSKDSSTFENASQSGDFNTPMHEYASEFAKRGYVTVSINYRKFLDGLPIPGTGTMAAGDWALMATVLSTIFSTTVTPAETQAELEMAALDTSNAIAWLIGQAGALGVDPSRVVVGGYSAGAYNSLGAAFVENAAVAGVWTNSGAFGGLGNEALFIDPAEQIPTIAFQGTLDPLVNFTTQGVPLRDELIAEGIPHEYYVMVGEDHWYLRSRTVTGSPSRAVPDTIENLVADFMFTQLNLSAIGGTIPLLPAASSRALILLVILLGGGASLVLLFGKRQHARCR